MKKSLKNTVCFLLTVTLAAAAFSMAGPEGTLCVSATATTDLEKKKNDAQKKIDELKGDISDTKKKVESLENDKLDLQAYIAKLDTQAQELNTQIEETQQQIDEKQTEIENTRLELEEATATAEQQYEDMKLRIQFMYENGNTSYLETLLTARSMAEALNRFEYVEQMSQYDRDMFDRYIAIKEEIAAFKLQLEGEEAELLAMSEELQEDKENLDALINKKTKELANYQALIAEANEDAKELSAELLKAEKALEQAEAAIAAAAMAAAAASSAGDGGKSGLMWPCPASHRITSNFGGRSAPVKGASTNHKGIDIGASTGSAIVAAAAGVVTTAAYSGSAGNYIVISHGGGLATVYMHCSALYVSEGTSVAKGQTIAAVGSTGYSTGPHLHFGVIKNGVYVNPRNYV